MSRSLLARAVQTALGVMACLAVWSASPCGAAESWLFQRSYYSHQPPTVVEVGPQSPYGTVFTRPQGAYVRGGYRQLRVGGNLRANNDFHFFYESWFQAGQQW